jgi:hypothetical protein
MEELYNYVLWYNHFKQTWYAIPRDQYAAFFDGKSEAYGVLVSWDVNHLIEAINNG